MNTKADPFRHQARWLAWKKHRNLTTRGQDLPLSVQNQKLIIDYLLDMESGFNVAGKGRRSFIRLNSIKGRITWVICRMGFDDITQVTARNVTDFFNQMRDGSITRRDGEPFKSTIDYIKVFAAFWHWYQRREAPRVIPDVTQFLESESKLESEFVYFTQEDLAAVTEHVKYFYRVMLWFMFDSGIRAPTELMSLKVRDFHYLPDQGIYELDIKNEYAKTFGRKIKLVMSSNRIKGFLKDKSPSAPFFKADWNNFCEYVKRAFVRVLGDTPTKGGKSFSAIRPYDFRHSSACHWVVRYKQEAAFKYRFGWKENRMIHYYTNFLGMQDTISENDLLLDSEAKTKLETKLEQQIQMNALMEERLKQLEHMIHRQAIGELNSKVLAEKSPSSHLPG